MHHQTQNNHLRGDFGPAVHKAGTELMLAVLNSPTGIGRKTDRFTASQPNRLTMHPVAKPINQQK